MIEKFSKKGLFHILSEITFYHLNMTIFVFFFSFRKKVRMQSEINIQDRIIGFFNQNDYVLKAFRKEKFNNKHYDFFLNSHLKF